MTSTTFTGWLQANGFSGFIDATVGDLELKDGSMTQSSFSVNYTAWLTEIVNTEAVRSHLALTESDVVTVELNQNSTGGAPFIKINGETSNALDGFFSDREDVLVATGKTSQLRWYSDSFTYPELPEPSPWGDDPYMIVAPESGALDGTDGVAGTDGLAGEAGTAGSSGVNAPEPGADGADGANGADAVGTGSAKTDATVGQAGAAGATGTKGGDGTIGIKGADGLNGTSGSDGEAALTVDSSHTSIVIEVTGDMVILGGDGGDGGAGGAGGNGGDGGIGGDGSDGGDGGDGGIGGDGTHQGGAASLQDGAAGGSGGAGGTGGAAGSGGTAGAGGDGGDGGAGGDGAVAIANGSVTNVFIVGSGSLTILGGEGGEGGAAGDGGFGGEGGTAGSGGDGGEGGTGGAGGSGSIQGSADGTNGTSGVDGKDGSAGAPGSDGGDGVDGAAGATGANGADGTGFAEAVNVDASGFSGTLTISGSNEADSMITGGGTSFIHATLGDDNYTLGSGADTLIYTSTTQSDGAMNNDIVSLFDASADKLDFSAIDANPATVSDDAFTVSTEALVANGIYWYQGTDKTVVELDNTGDTTADMTITLIGTHVLDNAFIL